MSTIEMPAAPSALVEARRWTGRRRRALRAWRDGLLRPWRERRTRARLREVPEPATILVLCLGNVCRSPYAEGRLRERLERAGRSASVTSAGFIGPGRPADETARAIARERGVDTSAHRSVVLDRTMIAGADLVLLVDPSHARRLRREIGRHETPVVVLGDLDPVSGDARLIRDPWGQDDDVFQRVFDRLDRCIDALVDALPGGSPRAAGSAR